MDRAAGPDPARSARPTVTVVGLGPAGPEYLTVAAQAALAAVPDWYVRTARHPAAEPLVAAGAVTLDRHYEEAPTFAAAYAGIVEELVAAATRRGRVGYAVPGSPSVLEATVRALLADDRVAVEVVEGMSFCELAWRRLGVDPVESRVRLVDGERFAVDAARDTGPLLVAGVWSPSILAAIKLAVASPPARAVVLQRLGCPRRARRGDRLRRDRPRRARTTSPVCTCQRSPSRSGSSSPGSSRSWSGSATSAPGTPRRPTARSCATSSRSATRRSRRSRRSASRRTSPLRRISRRSSATCSARSSSTRSSPAGEGLFTLGDVATTVHDKLVRRHPHVFGGIEGVDSVDAVLSQWEELKRREKGRESVMDGIPAGLPSLVLVAKLERKAAGVGLGWGATGGAAAGPSTTSQAADAEEFGELFLALARLAADRGVDAEEAMRRAAMRFRARFAVAERLAAAAGTTLAAATVKAGRAYWGAAGAA